MAARKAPSKKPKKPQEPSFEDRLEALEQVVEDLEGEDLGLEASIERYREGVEHLQACRALLDDAEQRLVELVKVGEAEEERPLQVGDGGLEPDDRD